jgi:hypothetical protein
MMPRMRATVAEYPGSRAHAATTAVRDKQHSWFREVPVPQGSLVPAY